MRSPFNRARLLRLPLNSRRLSYPRLPASATKTAAMLAPSTAPLVFIDCEMTGLKSTDVLLSVACFITTPNLELVDPAGLSLTINRSATVLEAMDEWCTRTHAESGLSAAVLSSTTTVDAAGQQLLAYLQKHVPVRGEALLAGNSVHVDKVFLQREMPAVADWLHYRILDVSAIKEAARRWCGEEVLRRVPQKKGLHQARDDVLESIEEARFWRENVFVAKAPDGL